MNERDDNHDFDPKHRIVGAVILVALAVIFLPMILNKQPEPPAVAPIAEIPPPDSKVVTAPVAPLEPASATPTAPAVSEPPREPAQAPPALKPAEPAPAPAVKPAKKVEKPEKPAAKVKKGWVVQAGVFASAENAKQLRDKLRKQGFMAEIDNLTVDAKSMARVRVGPYPDNAAAKAAQARLQKEAGVKGVVLAYP
jgi:DedD protein